MSYQINELIEVFTTLVGEAAYFRIEIFKASHAPNDEFFFSEVYMLRWPTGVMKMKAPATVDITFHQSWDYLDEFPAIRAASLDEVKARAMDNVQSYGLSYLSTYVTKRKLQR